MVLLVLLLMLAVGEGKQRTHTFSCSVRSNQANRDMEKMLELRCAHTEPCLCGSWEKRNLIRKSELVSLTNVIAVNEPVNSHQEDVDILVILFYNDPQAMIQKCSTGHVGIEDSAGGSAMLRSTSLVITVALEDTGRPAKITKWDLYIC